MIGHTAYDSKPIDDLGLSRRSYNALRRHGIEFVGDLIRQSEADLWNIRGFGAECMAETLGALAYMEVRLARQDGDEGAEPNTAEAPAEPSDFEVIPLGSVDWGCRSKPGATLTARVAKALAYLQAHPHEGVVVTIPEGLVSETGRVTTTIAALGHKGRFTTRKIGPRRVAIARRDVALS